MPFQRHGSPMVKGEWLGRLPCHERWCGTGQRRWRRSDHHSTRFDITLHRHRPPRTRLDPPGRLTRSSHVALTSVWFKVSVDREGRCSTNLDLQHDRTREMRNKSLKTDTPCILARITLASARELLRWRREWTAQPCGSSLFSRRSVHPTCFLLEAHVPRALKTTGPSSSHPSSKDFRATQDHQARTDRVPRVPDPGHAGTAKIEPRLGDLPSRPRSTCIPHSRAATYQGRRASSKPSPVHLILEPPRSGSQRAQHPEEDCLSVLG